MKKENEIQVEKAKLKLNEHKDNLPGFAQAFLAILFKLLNELQVTTLLPALSFRSQRRFSRPEIFKNSCRE